MKKLLCSIVLAWVCLLSPGFGQGTLDASVSYATFKSMDGGFVEVYLHIVGKSIEFAALTDSTKQASANVVVLFKKGGEVVKFDKFRLNSPVSPAAIDFVDVKRYGLENGAYQIEVSVEDANRAENSKKYASNISLDYDGQALSQSDIQLLASIKPAPAGTSNKSQMVKSGYVFEPLPANFYDKNAALLLFYQEIYNADKAIGADYEVSYFLDDEDTRDKVEVLSMSHKRKSPEPVTALLYQIDISKLPSGNYQLVVEVRNRERQLLSKKTVSFQRSNPYLQLDRETIASGNVSLDEEFVGKMDTDTLAYALKAIAMQVDKSDGEQLKLLVKERNPSAMKLYLFSYWAQKNPTNPKAAYDIYMNVARKIDEKFRNGFGYGFETDRGYVFLKYGAPNDIVSEENEPSAPPYEIWFYNQFPATNQNNVKFLFYNPNLTTNGFTLLHSTARGEVNNPRWEVTLYRNSPTEIQGNDYIDGTQMQGNTGRQARRLFESY